MGLTAWVVRDSGEAPSEALALLPTPQKGPSWLGPKEPTQHLSLSCGLWGSHKLPGSWPRAPGGPQPRAVLPSGPPPFKDLWFHHPQLGDGGRPKGARIRQGHLDDAMV